MGFNIIDELDIYGNLISDIHIKDRKIGGGPVMLGQGIANLKFLNDNIFLVNKNFGIEKPNINRVEVSSIVLKILV